MYEVTVTSVGAVGLLRLVAVPDVADARRQAGGGGHDGGGDHGDGGQTGNTCEEEKLRYEEVTHHGPRLHAEHVPFRRHEKKEHQDKIFL